MKHSRAKLLGQPPVIPSVCEGPGEAGLVSVLIPTYNRAYILGSAIESVLRQSYRPIEVVVVDDGSTDDTRSLVEGFAPEVRYIYQPNGGLAAARNTGLAAARGEFIAFQDSDDIWLPWKLQAQVAVMRHAPEVALVWTDMTAVNPRGEVVDERHLRRMYSAYGMIEPEETFPHTGRVGDVCGDVPGDIADCAFRYGDIFSAMLLGNLVHPPTALMRRSCVRQTGGLDVTYTWAGEDYEFFWRLSRHGWGAVIEAPAMLYRVGDADQYTHPTVPSAVSMGYLLAVRGHLARDRYRIKLPDRIVRHALAEAHAWVAEEALGSAEGEGAAWHFWNCLRRNPLHKRALFLFPFSLVPRPLFRLAKLSKQRLMAMLRRGRVHTSARRAESGACVG